MRVAALYDVHGILPALEAVLADPRCRAAGVIVCGGDLVAGPLPAESLELLEADTRVRFLRATGFRPPVPPRAAAPLAVVGVGPAARLGAERIDRIARWPATVELEVSGLGNVLFCHATPSSDTDILTAVTPDEDVATALTGVPADVVVCGHTHVQYDRRVGNTRLVNAGSVGMPYEGSPDARWAILDDGAISLVSTPYDAGAALVALTAAGFPMLDDWYAGVARGEITAEEATAIFEGRRRGA